MKVIIISFFTLIFSFTLSAQTYRDTLAYEIVHSLPKDKTSYEKLKENIKNLEKLEEKHNPEILNSKLRYIFEQNDFNYFKETLTLLTRYYGYNVSYLSGKENYYESIMYGHLADWFKEMYIKNHSEWLSENLHKQIDIHKLNSLHQKDQVANNTLLSIQQNLRLNSDQKAQIRKMQGEVFSLNIKELNSISSKIGCLPTGNSFAIIQNNYDLIEWHGFQHEETFQSTLEILLPYYKKSYLNKDISSLKFKNIDSFLFMNTGKQMFGLLNPERIPEHLRKDLSDKDSIPLMDPKTTNQLKQELKWY